MAKVSTTATSAIGVNDTSIAVTSATGFAPGAIVKIDQEVLKVQQAYISGLSIPVLRGRDGSATATHKVSAIVVVQGAADLPSPLAPTTVTAFSATKARVFTSYSAAGAITVQQPGVDQTVELLGTVALAMTLASPSVDMDGDQLTIISAGKAAHTVTYAAGLGGVGGTADVLTFAATQGQAFTLVAAGGFWTGTGAVAAAATIAGVGIA
jgi:hypothetical protein